MPAEGNGVALPDFLADAGHQDTAQAETPSAGPPRTFLGMPEGRLTQSRGTGRCPSEVLQ